MGDPGIASVFTAAFGYVPTLFSYFSPSKSPYYSMTVAGIAAICVLMLVGPAAWLAALLPICVVLTFLAYGTIASPKFKFSVDEYNDQLKFARSLAITTAVICLAFVVHNPRNPMGPTPLEPVDDKIQSDGPPNPLLNFMIIGVYVLCISQIIIFLGYHFVFAGYDETVETVDDGNRIVDSRHREERNYVQVALVMCAYLAGMTIISYHAHQPSIYETIAMGFFAGVWILCGFQVASFVHDNFSLAPPVNVVRPLQATPTNVITLKQVEKTAAQ